MKQFIEIEQLKELNYEQFKKISMFLDTQYKNLSKETWESAFKEKYSNIFIVVSERLSIGKMFEILQERKVDIGAYTSLSDNQICNSLFEALKEVL